MALLFINGCISQRSDSRTLLLARTFLEAYGKPYETVDLRTMALAPFQKEQLEARDALLAQGALDHPCFAPARQFAQAEEIVLAAPYWDLSFPAQLKIYIEHLCVNGIAFRYGARGPEGLCRAKRMLYLSSAGGFTEGMDFGGDYLQGLCRLFGIPRFERVYAEGLDIRELNPAVQLDAALEAAKQTAARWR